MSDRKGSLAVTVTGLLAAAVLLVPAGARASARAVANEVWEADWMEGFSLSVDVSLGALSGEALERVWEGNDKLSELQWDLEGLWMAGVTGTLGISERFRVNAGYWIALNEGDGTMVDLDWVWPSGTPYADSDWTDRSEHPDTTVDGTGSFDVNVDILAFSREGLHLSGIVGYRQDRYEWSSRGGTGLYSVSEFRDTPVRFPEGGLVIEYEQAYRVPYFGIGVDGSFEKFLLNAYLLYSPWVTAEDKDFHVLRNFLAEGKFSGGDYLAAGVSGSYRFTSRAYVALAVDYQDYSEIRGDVSNSFFDEGIAFTVDEGGSVALQALTLSLSVGWMF